MKKVMTAPLAIIQINSVTVGKMKNVRITENIRRGRVTGVGRLNPDELPALEWTGSLSCSFIYYKLQSFSEQDEERRGLQECGNS